MNRVWWECVVGRDKMERGVLRCGKSQHSSLGVVWWSGFISYDGGGGVFSSGFISYDGGGGVFSSGFISYDGGGGVFSRGFLWLGRLCFRWGRGNIGGNSGRV